MSAVTGHWPNLAAFRAWAAEIDRLASETPDEPIPFEVVWVPEVQPDIPEAVREWANSVGEPAPTLRPRLL